MDKGDHSGLSYSVRAFCFWHGPALARQAGTGPSNDWRQPGKPKPKRASKGLYPRGFHGRSECHPCAASSRESTPAHSTLVVTAEATSRNLRDLLAQSCKHHLHVSEQIEQSNCQSKSPIVKMALILLGSTCVPSPSPFMAGECGAKSLANQLPWDAGQPSEGRKVRIQPPLPRYGSQPSIQPA